VGRGSGTVAAGLVSAFWKDRPTLVTGATGLVGSWTVRRLLDLGARPVCLVRTLTPESELVRSGAIARCRVVRGDLGDLLLLERSLAEYGIQTVIHLGAQAVVTVAQRDPVATFETNIRGTWHLLEACRQSPLVAQVIVASSDKAYGSHDLLPYTETAALHGRGPYDVSKACAGMLAQAYATSYDLPVAITRFANFYGGGDLHWSRIVPGTIRSVLSGERPLIRSDGRFIREYFYVEDAAAAYTLLAERVAENPDLRGEAFNFSYEDPIAVSDIVARILRLMGSELEPDVRNEVSNEIFEQSLSAQKARQLLGWTPRFSLDEGLQRTIAWYTDYLHK
jgi:CDP-glucose 4,6-dehydratase